MSQFATALQWDAQGVDVTLVDQDGAAEHKRLSHAEVAQLTNYDAIALGLPQVMEAMLVLRAEGRIDMPDFRVRRSIEPFNQMHPWVVYRREGALLFVGERMMRLNLHQLHIMEALDALQGAENNIAQRLHVWTQLTEALHTHGKSHVLVQGDLPHLRVLKTRHFPANAMTRIGKQLQLATAVPDAQWAMDAGRRYYLRAA